MARYARPGQQSPTFFNPSWFAVFILAIAAVNLSYLALVNSTKHPADDHEPRIHGEGQHRIKLKPILTEDPADAASTNVRYVGGDDAQGAKSTTQPAATAAPVDTPKPAEATPLATATPSGTGGYDGSNPCHTEEHAEYNADQVRAQFQTHIVGALLSVLGLLCL